MLYCFGAGHRCCIGSKFIRQILLDLMRELLCQYDWFLHPHDQQISYKYFPVARPANDVTIMFKLKQ